MSEKNTLWISWDNRGSDALVNELGKNWCITMHGISDDLEQAVNALQPFAVVFDCDYPTRSCLQRMLNIRLLFPALPALMLCSETSVELLTWALRVRAWDYLVKPIDIQQLMNRLAFLSVSMDTEQKVLPLDIVNESLTRVEMQPKATAAAVKLIKERYCDHISLHDAARHCGMSRCHFSRIFRREHGVTFQEFLIRERVERACALLRNKGQSVTDIGLAVGFNDLSNFTRTFYRYVGKRPSQYRKWDNRT